MSTPYYSPDYTPYYVPSAPPYNLSTNCSDYSFQPKYPLLPAPPTKVISAPPGTPQSVIDSAIKSAYPGSIITITSTSGAMTVAQPDLKDPRDEAAFKAYEKNIGTLIEGIIEPGLFPVSAMVSAWNCLSATDKNGVLNYVSVWALSHPHFDPQWFLKNPSNTELQNQKTAAAGIAPQAVQASVAPQAIQASTNIALPVSGGSNIQQTPIDSSNAGSTPNSTGGYITQVETDIKQALSNKTYVLLGGAAVILLSLYVMSKEG
jgi:hypothetical protein